MKLLRNHGKHLKNEKMRLPLSAYLVYLLVATLLFNGVSFSKYASTFSGENSARIAVMAINTSHVISQSLPIAPGEKLDYYVTLTNKENDRICEVTQDYTMTVSNLTNNMDLVFEYFRVNGTGETKLDTMSGRFRAGIEETATYKITVSWPEKPQPASNAFEVDGIKVIVRAAQVD